jgi:hypothetical protein
MVGRPTSSGPRFIDSCRVYIPNGQSVCLRDVLARLTEKHPTLAPLVDEPDAQKFSCLGMECYVIRDTRTGGWIRWVRITTSKRVETPTQIEELKLCTVSSSEGMYVGAPTGGLMPRDALKDLVRNDAFDAEVAGYRARSRIWRALIRPPVKPTTPIQNGVAYESMYMAMRSTREIVDLVLGTTLGISASRQGLLCPQPDQYAFQH